MTWYEICSSSGEAKGQGQGREVQRAHSQGQDAERERSVPAFEERQKGQKLETHGHKGHFCARQFHEETAQIRAFYPSDRFKDEEGPCDPSRAPGDLSLAHHRGQKEPLVHDVHVVGGHHQGHGHRGQHFRVGHGHSWREGRLGKVRPGH